jgi:hypothetical protein
VIPTGVLYILESFVVVGAKIEALDTKTNSGFRLSLLPLKRVSLKIVCGTQHALLTVIVNFVHMCQMLHLEHGFVWC